MAKAQGHVHPRLDQVDGGIVHQQAQAQLRKARQPGAQGRGSMPGKADRGGQAQLATGLLAFGHQLGPCALRGIGQGGALQVKALAGITHSDLAGGTVQQGDAGLALQLADVLAHGRGRHAQLLGGGRHAARLHHGGEHGHAFEVFHAAIVKLYFKVLVQSAWFLPVSGL